MKEMTIFEICNLERLRAMAVNRDQPSRMTTDSYLTILAEKWTSLEFDQAADALKSKNSCVNFSLTEDRLDERELRDLLVILNSATHAFDSESKKRTVIEVSCPSSSQINLFLDSLKAKGQILKDYQQAMFDDMLSCLKVDAFRPAIVAGWTLCYDILRCWIFNNQQRLAAFNSWLSNSTKDNRCIQQYEDFFHESESFVLTGFWKAQSALSVFTEKHHRTWQNLLDERNAYAHANYRQASRPKAEAFIEKLFDLILELPFEKSV